MDANTDAKGDPADVKSFLDVHASEPRCAAYLGYKDLAEFRKFLVSHHFLTFYLFYVDNVASKMASRSSKVALEILRDLRDTDINFPADLNHAIAKYPIVSVAKGKHASRDDQERAKQKQNEKNANYILATILYRAAEYFAYFTNLSFLNSR